MNDNLNLEQAQWMDEKIRQASYPCPACNGAGGFASVCSQCAGKKVMHYTGMTDYLERHGGGWPSLVWNEQGSVNSYHTKPPKAAPGYYHALPFISANGERGALEILMREFGIVIERRSRWQFFAFHDGESYRHGGDWVSADTPSALFDMLVSILKITSQSSRKQASNYRLLRAST